METIFDLLRYFVHNFVSHDETKKKALEIIDAADPDSQASGSNGSEKGGASAEAGQG